MWLINPVHVAQNSPPTGQSACPYWGERLSLLGKGAVYCDHISTDATLATKNTKGENSIVHKSQLFTIATNTNFCHL